MSATLYKNYHRFSTGQEAEEAFRNEEVSINSHAVFFEWIRREVKPEDVEKIKEHPIKLILRNCYRDFKDVNEIFTAYIEEEMTKPESERRWITDWYFSELGFAEIETDENDG